MDLLRDHIAASGSDAEGLVIAGVVGLSFAETKDLYSGGKVDEYRKVVLSLHLMREEEIVLSLSPDSPVFADTAKWLERINQLPLYTKLVTHGDPAPTDQSGFAIPLKKANILASADKAFYQALMSGDEARLEEVAWIRFQQSKAFERDPCSREFFLDLRKEFIALSYLGTLGFSDYYNFYRRSARHLDDDGNLKPETLAQANSMLDAWSGQDTESHRYWLIRNLDVHPRHRAPFYALIDARASAAKPEDAADVDDDELASSAPGPR